MLENSKMGNSSKEGGYNQMVPSSMAALTITSQRVMESGTSKTEISSRATTPRLEEQMSMKKTTSSLLGTPQVTSPLQLFDKFLKTYFT